MPFRFDRRAILLGLVFAILAFAATLVWLEVLGGIPGAIALIFPSFFLWLLLFAWVARKTLARGG